jgi:hypothetical protein
MDYVAIVSFLNALQQQFVEDPGRMAHKSAAAIAAAQT